MVFIIITLWQNLLIANRHIRPHSDPVPSFHAHFPRPPSHFRLTELSTIEANYHDQAYIMSVSEVLGVILWNRAILLNAHSSRRRWELQHNSVSVGGAVSGDTATGLIWGMTPGEINWENFVFIWVTDPNLLIF